MSTYSVTFTDEHNYSFVNEVKSEDQSVGVTGGKAEVDLSLTLEVSGESIFYFDAPGETNPGSHVLRVRETAEGLVLAGSGGSLTTLAWPAKSSILIFRGGKPEWFAVGDEEEAQILGQSGGSFHWYGLRTCEEEEE